MMFVDPDGGTPAQRRQAYQAATAAVMTPENITWQQDVDEVEEFSFFLHNFGNVLVAPHVFEGDPLDPNSLMIVPGGVPHAGPRVPTGEERLSLFCVLERDCSEMYDNNTQHSKLTVLLHLAKILVNHVADHKERKGFGDVPWLQDAALLVRLAIETNLDYPSAASPTGMYNGSENSIDKYIILCIEAAGEFKKSNLMVEVEMPKKKKGKQAKGVTSPPPPTHRGGNK